MQKLLLTILATLTLASCSLGRTGLAHINDLRAEVEVMQKDEEVKLYAPELLKQTENSLIKSVNAWNRGARSESNSEAENTEKYIEATRKQVAENKKLGLSEEAWRQRKYLIEQREEKLKNKNA